MFSKLISFFEDSKYGTLIRNLHITEIFFVTLR